MSIIRILAERGPGYGYWLKEAQEMIFGWKRPIKRLLVEIDPVIGSWPDQAQLGVSSWIRSYLSDSGSNWLLVCVCAFYALICIKVALFWIVWFRWLLMLRLAVSLDSTFGISKSRDWPFGDFLLSGVESFQAGQDYVDGRDWRECRLWAVFSFLCISIYVTLTVISGMHVLMWFELCLTL